MAKYILLFLAFITIAIASDKTYICAGVNRFHKQNEYIIGLHHELSEISGISYQWNLLGRHGLFYDRTMVRYAPVKILLSPGFLYDKKVSFMFSLSLTVAVRLDVLSSSR